MAQGVESRFGKGESIPGRLVLGEEAAKGKNKVKIPTFFLSHLTDILGKLKIQHFSSHT